MRSLISIDSLPVIVPATTVSPTGASPTYLSCSGGLARIDNGPSHDGAGPAAECVGLTYPIGAFGIARAEHSAAPNDTARSGDQRSLQISACGARHLGAVPTFAPSLSGHAVLAPRSRGEGGGTNRQHLTAAVAPCADGLQTWRGAVAKEPTHV